MYCKIRNNGTNEAFPHSAVNQTGIHAQERHILLTAMWLEGA
jgi:hypothetical protein